MSNIKDTTKIAGDYTVADWKRDRETLTHNGDTHAWQRAFGTFRTRIETRFLSPINTILKSDKAEGEGFAVVAIQCILVEFLAAFYFGKVYVPPSDPGNASGAHAYSSSAKLVKDFLTTCEPFKASFKSSTIAGTFFSDFRCGLLHEAATKKSALIRAGHSNPGTIIEKKDSGFVLYRNNFQEAILDFLENYREKLLTSKDLQASFVRKMDDICQIG